MSILRRAVCVPLSYSGNGLTCFYNRRAVLSSTQPLFQLTPICPDQLINTPSPANNTAPISHLFSHTRQYLDLQSSTLIAQSRLANRCSSGTVFFSWARAGRLLTTPCGRMANPLLEATPKRNFHGPWEFPVLVHKECTRPST